MIDIKKWLPGDRHSWILAGGVVGVAMLGLIIVVGPIRGSMRELNATVVEQERILAHHLGVLAPRSVSAVTNEYGRFGSTIRMKGSSDEENSRMLSEVDRLAGENKIGLSATKPSVTRKDSDTESYSVEIEVETSLSQLIGFIYAVESSPQLLRVERLILNSKGEKAVDVLHGNLLISKVVTL